MKTEETTTGIEADANAESGRTLLEVDGISAHLARRLASLDPPVRTLGDFADRQATMAEEDKPWWDGIKYVTAVRGRAIEKAVEAHWQAWTVGRGDY